MKIIQQKVEGRREGKGESPLIRYTYTDYYYNVAERCPLK